MLAKIKRIAHLLLTKISVIFTCLLTALALFFYFVNSYYISIIQDRIIDSYKGIANYYTNEINTKLSSILEHMAIYTQDNDYITVTYGVNQDSDQYNLSKHKLYQKLSSDILSLKPMDYYVVYRPTKGCFMLIPSASLTYNTSHSDMSSYIKSYIEEQESTKAGFTERWMIVSLGDSEYLCRFIVENETYFGSCISVDRLINQTGLLETETLSLTFVENNEIVKDDTLRTSFLYPIQNSTFSIRTNIYNIALNRQISSISQRGVYFIACIMIMTLIIFIFVQFEISRPVGQIVKTMEKVRDGNIDCQMQTKMSCHEFDLISNTFNTMMEQIRNGRIRIYEQKLVEERLRMQCYMLQINPHFFLNALNTLYLLNKRGDNERSKVLLTYLISYFQNIFSESSDYISLDQELRTVENYVAIHKFRHEQSVSIEYQIEESSRSALIPFMSIMTFVENSLKYAWTNNNEIRIVVRSMIDADHIVLIIEDNGKGFPDEELKKILNLKPIVRQERSHIGICNVLSRMRAYYGEDQYFDIKNKEDGGAYVKLSFPFTIVQKTSG